MLMFLFRSPRSTPLRSRTSVSGSATTPAPAPTTCTRSTVRPRGPLPSRPSTPTWPPATVPASGPSTYDARASLISAGRGTDNGCRSSALLSSRRPRTSSAPTSSSSSPRTSLSPSPTASPRSATRRSSARRARPPLLEGSLHGCGWGWQVLQVFIRKWDILHLLPNTSMK